MSDLISREFLQTAIHNFFNGLNHTPTEEDIQRYIEVAPSADIMECARSLKEHCNEHLRKPHTLCDDCPMFEGVCRRFNVVPRWWDLPEGEKKSPIFIDSAPLKDCKNTAESYGEICVRCNKCGRFGKEKE